MSRLKRRLFIAIGPIFMLVLGACAGAAPTATPLPLPTVAPTQNPLTGGLLAEFELNDQHFKVWVTNPETIQQLLDLKSGKSEAGIPNGKILNGPGIADYNAPWTWHLDPQDINMADMTTEVCDAEPKYVEENVKEFVDVVGRYCPWSATLVSLTDYR